MLQLLIHDDVSCLKALIELMDDVSFLKALHELIDVFDLLVIFYRATFMNL